METAEKYHGHFWIKKPLQNVLKDLEKPRLVYPGSSPKTCGPLETDHERKAYSSNYIQSIPIAFTKSEGNTTSK